MPTRTHYYDNGRPLCGLDAPSWNWSVDPRALSCVRCRELVEARLDALMSDGASAPAGTARDRDS